jgi:RimJ/RimL family protein N-acetyltransferase
MILTRRTCLRPFRDSDRRGFRALVQDAAVMADQGGPMRTDEADAKLDGYMLAWERFGCSRMALETHDGEFLGYVGTMAHATDHPLGAHHDIGWRLVRASWGQGLASEAAKAALADGFSRLRLSEVLAYTEATNLRSIKLMQRLGLSRDASRDFTAHYDRIGEWRGLVWVASPI